MTVGVEAPPRPRQPAAASQPPPARRRQAAGARPPLPAGSARVAQKGHQGSATSGWRGVGTGPTTARQQAGQVHGAPPTLMGARVAAQVARGAPSAPPAAVQDRKEHTARTPQPLCPDGPGSCAQTARGHRHFQRGHFSAAPSHLGAPPSSRSSTPLARPQAASRALTPGPVWWGRETWRPTYSLKASYSVRSMSSPQALAASRPAVSLTWGTMALRITVARHSDRYLATRPRPLPPSRLCRRALKRCKPAPPPSSQSERRAAWTDAVRSHTSRESRRPLGLPRLAASPYRAAIFPARSPAPPQTSGSRSSTWSFREYLMPPILYTPRYLPTTAAAMKPRPLEEAPKMPPAETPGGAGEGSVSQGRPSRTSVPSISVEHRTSPEPDQKRPVRGERAGQHAATRLTGQSMSTRGAPPASSGRTT